jgi:sulfur carrier protein
VGSAHVTGALFLMSGQESSDQLEAFVNGEACALKEGTTVNDVVAQLLTSHKGIAVALNGEVLARSAWPTTALKAGDRLEVLSAAPGG